MSLMTLTFTDEAPALASAIHFEALKYFISEAGINTEVVDISLAGRIIAAFPEAAPSGNPVTDGLAYLGELVNDPNSIIIKLPNISASRSQMIAAIDELRELGYELPDYPEDEQKYPDIFQRYEAVRGSVVNPVLRQGNSDRHPPPSVVANARQNPPRNRDWPANSQTEIATMAEGDFRSNELSVRMGAPDTLKIILKDVTSGVTELKTGIKVGEGDVLDSTFMSVTALEAFLAQQMAEAKRKGVLFSLHLKTTMMKVADPIIFGHAIRVLLKPVFEKYAQELNQLQINPNHGLAAMLDTLEDSGALGREILAAINQAIDAGPDLAMVDSDKGITNLHVPSDIIIDASMPPMIRDSGQMWNSAGELQDTIAVIPDSSYSGIYSAVVRDCQVNGPYDPTTMGTVHNIGLMADKAEEYGSHDKTFEIPTSGTIQVVDSKGRILMQHDVDTGDIWRTCHTKAAAISFWIQLTSERAIATKLDPLFYLDPERPHDALLIEAIEADLSEGISCQFLSPYDATAETVRLVRDGKDVLACTGNVLRDYLTDLWPILQVGASAKMLSIVGQIAGGTMFETGAGGSAPKHVQQLVAENHLRWDSLGEFAAYVEALRKIGIRDNNPKASEMGDALDEAMNRVQKENKGPGRKVGQLDNRGSQYYYFLFWAEILAESTDAELKAAFAPIFEGLRDSETKILEELSQGSGEAIQLGGYYRPSPEAVEVIMRPSETLNSLFG